MNLRNKTHLQHRRKMFHMAGVMAMYLQLNYLSIQFCWISLITCSVLFLGCDLLRMYSKSFNQLAIKILGPILRDSEENSFAGTTYLLIGAIISFSVFEPKVVLLSLLFLGIGDPISSWFGVRFGSKKIVGKKTVEGSVAGLVVCFILSMLYFNTKGMFVNNLILVSLLTGFIGILSEVVPIGKLDDNLTQPIVSGSLLTLFFWWQGVL